MEKSRRSAPRYINKLSNKIRRQMDSFTQITGVSPAEARVLSFLLDQPGPIYQKDIEEEYSMRPPSASALLKKMEQDNLVRRENVEEDGRYKKIVVTEKGLSYKDDVKAKIRQMEDIVTDGITEEDMEVFYRVVEQMFDNMP